MQTSSWRKGTALAAVWLLQHPTLASTALPVHGGARATLSLAALQTDRWRSTPSRCAELEQAITNGRQIYITLRLPTAARLPKTAYNVYLNLPARVQPLGATDLHYAGTISSFSRVDSVGTASVTLNATKRASALCSREFRSQFLTVSLVPIGAVHRRIVISSLKLEIR